MKKLFWVVLLVLVPTPALATEEVDAFLKCVEDNTVALGKSNSEPADTVLRAAYSECRFEEGMAVLSRALKEAEAGIRPRMSDSARHEAEVRKRAGDRAINALLKARAAN